MKSSKKPAKNMILMKFKSLLAAIESHNPNIDNSGEPEATNSAVSIYYS